MAFERVPAMPMATRTLLFSTLRPCPRARPGRWGRPATNRSRGVGNGEATTRRTAVERTRAANSNQMYSMYASVNHAAAFEVGLGRGACVSVNVWLDVQAKYNDRKTWAALSVARRPRRHDLHPWREADEGAGMIGAGGADANGRIAGASFARVWIFTWRLGTLVGQVGLEPASSLCGCLQRPCQP